MRDLFPRLRQLSGLPPHTPILLYEEVKPTLVEPIEDVDAALEKVGRDRNGDKDGERGGGDGGGTWVTYFGGQLSSLKTIWKVHWVAAMIRRR
jgi:hypothetical protein